MWRQAHQPFQCTKGGRSMPQGIGYVEEFATAHRRLVQSGMHPLRAARKLYALSTRELAAEVGLCRHTIENIEQERYRPTQETCQRLLTYFGVDAEELSLPPGSDSLEDFPT